MIELTEQEEALILKQREQRNVNAHGAYSPMTKPDTYQAELRTRMEALHANQITQGFGFLPRAASNAVLR